MSKKQPSPLGFSVEQFGAVRQLFAEPQPLQEGDVQLRAEQVVVAGRTEQKFSVDSHTLA